MRPETWQPDPKQVGARIRERYKALDMSQEDLAHQVNCTQGMISQIVQGTISKTSLYPQIAEALAVNLDWLLGKTDKMIQLFGADGMAVPEAEWLAGNRLVEQPGVAAPKRGYRSEAEEFGTTAFDVVAVRELDLSLGMGERYWDVPVTEEVHHFPRAWLRQYTRAAPDKLLFAQGMGDSMFPTLQDSDVLLIDCSQDRLTMADRIWAIAYAECGMIKRLRPLPDGGVAIMSDNPSVPDTIAYDGELHIMGRVCAVMRKI